MYNSRTRCGVKIVCHDVISCFHFFSFFFSFYLNSTFSCCTWQLSSRYDFAIIPYSFENRFKLIMYHLHFYNSIIFSYFLIFFNVLFLPFSSNLSAKVWIKFDMLIFKVFLKTFYWTKKLQQKKQFAIRFKDKRLNSQSYLSKRKGPKIR